MFGSIHKKISALLAMALIFAGTSVFAAEENPKLYVEEAYEIGTNAIAIVFSNPISEWSLADDGSLFRIEDINNPQEYYDVINKEIDEYDKNIMILTLSQDFVDSREYRVIVLSIEDIYGQNILYGVDSEATFVYYFNENLATIDDTFGQEDLNSAVDENANQDNNVDNNNNGNTDNNTDNGNETNIDNPEANLGGETLNAGDVESQVDMVATDNSKLPQAGPEHIVLLVLALIIGCGLFVFRYRKL